MTVVQQDATTVMALDIGEKRTGVALAYSSIGIASPYKTLEQSNDLPAIIADLVRDQQTKTLVIGLPRNLSGEKTLQTRYVEITAAKIKRALTIPVYFVDEALTSVKAEQELRGRGRPYTKPEVDMLAATYILDDFLKEHPGLRSV